MTHQLFSPVSFGSLQVRNRIIIPPMCTYTAEDGKPTDWHFIHFSTMGQSGAGLFIAEATAVLPEGRISYGDLGLWDEERAAALQKLLTQTRQFMSMPVAIQLNHAGRKASMEKPWLGRNPLPPGHENGWQTVSASDIPFDHHSIKPVALEQQGISEIITAFANAAERAVRIGFDLVEIHAAHGYLLHQFLSPLSNTRTDDYGGSLENRMRLVLEIFDAIKQKVPTGFPIGVRISATDWVKDGWDLEQSIVLAKELEKRGMAYMHVSSGGLSADQAIQAGPSYQAPFADAIKQEISTPVIAVGLITEPEQAESILENKKADAIAIGRGMLFNPRWPWQAAAALGASVICAPQYLRSAPHDTKGLFIPFENGR